jgi:hypothetical protein
LKLTMITLFFLSTLVAVTPTSAAGNRCKDRCNKIYHHRKDECKGLRKWDRRRCEERAKADHEACKSRCR